MRPDRTVPAPRASRASRAGRAPFVSLLWLTLGATSLWWLAVAAATDGFDGEPCGERAAFTGGCLRALDFADRWGGRSLLLCLLVTSILTVLSRGVTTSAVSRRLRGWLFAAGLALALVSATAAVVALEQHGDAAAWVSAQ